MFNSKENVLSYFLYEQIRLSKYDNSFVSNLYVLIQKNKIVTTNQADLFDKIILKYQKQLYKLGHNASYLVSLNWKVPIEPSSVAFTGAKLSLVDNMIVVKVPFNKKFINELKQNNDSYHWDSVDKAYKSTFTTLSFKYMVQKLPKFFEHVIYCTESQKLLDKLAPYNANNLLWNPALVKTKNNKYFVSGINETLYEKIKNFELSDDLQCLYELSKLGISINDNIIQNDNRKLFASNFIYYTDIEFLSELNKIFSEFNITKVYLTHSFLSRLHSKNYIKYDFVKLLNNVSLIPHTQITNKDKDVIFLSIGTTLMNSAIINSKIISKIIVITNSNPIDTK